MTNKNSEKAFVYLPIEVKAREYNSKLLFSCFAAREGFNVVLGNRKRLQKLLKRLPKGIFIEKGIESPGKAKAISKYIRYGNKVAAWDEEGLVYIDRETYKKGRIKIDALRQLDIFFAWGQNQAEIVLEIIKDNNLDGDIVKITGNPRVDLLNSDFKQLFYNKYSSLKERYSPYILINSNFTVVNPYDGHEKNMEKYRKRGYLATKADEKKLYALLEEKRILYNHFLKILPLLSKLYKDHNIIIRPHPSELHSPWEEAAANLKNVLVINDGSNIVPWILASDAVIHNGCTTAVEAYLLNKEAIAYCPINAEQCEEDLPNQLSTIAHDSDALVQVLNNIIYGEGENSGLRDAKNKIAKKHFKNLDGQLACELILDELKKISLAPQDFHYSDHMLKKFYRRYLLRKELTVEKKIKKSSAKKKKELYVMHKFQGLSLREIKSDLAKLSKIESSFSKIMVKPLGDYCFYITKKD